MKNVISFILTVATFVGAWKFFPERIIASSYGDCVLAAVVFYLVTFLIGVVIVVGSAVLLKLADITMTDGRLIAYLICIILVGFACIPISLWVMTKFVNYQIVGTAAYLIMWFVLGIFTANGSNNEKNKNKTNKCYY